jgi:hypothetical protein
MELTTLVLRVTVPADEAETAQELLMDTVCEGADFGCTFSIQSLKATPEEEKEYNEAFDVEDSN